MYASSYPNYLEVANDDRATSIISPQIRGKYDTLTRAVKPQAVNVLKTLTATGDARAFLNKLLEMISAMLSESDDAFRSSMSAVERYTVGMFQTPLESKTLIDNMKDLTITMSRAEFISLTVTAQQAFRNLYIVNEQPNTKVTSAVFTNDMNARAYRKGGVPVYSGVDINVIFLTPHVVTNTSIMKTLSYSSHMEKREVTALGKTMPKGFSDSRRIIAGSMIGTVSSSDPLMELHPEWFDHEINTQVDSASIYKPYLLTDQLPLFDIMIIFQNEYGTMSAFTIFGVTIPDHGIVMSVDDSVIEATYQYKAMDVDVIHEVTTEQTTERYKDENGKTQTRVVNKMIDVLHNDEYILRHNAVLKGESLHESILDVPYLWNEMSRNINEINYLKKHIPQSVTGVVNKP